MIEKIRKGLGIFYLFWEILNRKQRFLFSLLFVIILVGAVLETVAVSIVIPFVWTILTPAELMCNSMVNKIITRFGIDSEVEFVVFVTACVIVFYIFKNVYSVLSAYWQQKYRCNIQKYISVSVLNKYLYSPYSFFIKTNSSELLRNIISDADELMNCINAVFSVLTQLFIILLLTVFLFITDSFVAICLVVSVVFVLLVPVLILGRPIRRTGVMLRENAAKCYKNALQALNGIKEIIMYGKQDFFSSEYDKSYQKKVDNDIKSCVYTLLPSKFIETICISILALALCVKRFYSSMDVAMIAQLGGFAMAALKLLPSVSTISQSFNRMVLSYPALVSIKENMISFSMVKNTLLPICENLSFTKKIKFEEVSFAYAGAAKSVFSNVNLIIEKGDVVGVVGPSGAGKTTFVDVLLGLLKNSSGKIYVDDSILDENNVLSWRSRIAYVPQTAYLIDDTIISNIAFGQAEKDVNYEKVEQAIKDAMLYDYIKALPCGMHTVVGERGIAMSGGQRQRVSIARALYINPEIIVFDEATSALDEKTEKEIMESIDSLIGKKTLLIIAHRLSTLKKCTKILNVEFGRITQKENLFESNKVT